MAQKKNDWYIRRIHRTGLPVGTIELAKYLIGKENVRIDKESPNELPGP
jgi:hypothetical protein